MLKVRKSENMGCTIFAFSGRIEETHLPELKNLIHAEVNSANTTLDLKEVRLVDREVVAFLAACRAEGIELKNCPTYVQVWIDTRRDIDHEA